MKKSSVIIVEADISLSKSIAEFLEDNTYQVTTFDDANSALEYAQDHGMPNVFLLGMNLPTISGFEAANRLKLMADVPVIFLMARTDRQHLVEGLKIYAEDFVIKPVDLYELETRIQIVLGRFPSIDYDDEPVVRVDEFLRIDFAQHRAYVSGRTLRLTPTEAVVLHVLIRSAPRVVRNRILLARLWPAEEVYEDNLRVHMHRLRRKLEVDSRHPRYIRTVRGVGYRFTVRPVEWPDDEDQV